MTTGTAAATTTSRATLTGTVNPLRQSTTYRFEYGTTTTYGSSVTASTNLPADSSDHAISQSILGLAASTSYHFRLVATNAAGTSYGADRTFTTPALPPAAASIRGHVGTLGARLMFTFACQGTAGQHCRGAATATAIEKLAVNGKIIIGLTPRRPRTGPYKVVVIARGDLTASAGRSTAAAIPLNPTGQMLRKKFHTVPADVSFTVTAGGTTKTVRTVKVRFGPDPPKLTFAATPATVHAAVRLRVRCKGLAGQLCRGTAKITTFVRLASDGHTITGLADRISGRGDVEALANARYLVKAGRTAQLVIELSTNGKRLLAKFGRIPATLKIEPTYSGYALAILTARITFRQ